MSDYLPLNKTNLVHAVQIGLLGAYGVKTPEELSKQEYVYSGHTKFAIGISVEWMLRSLALNSNSKNVKYPLRDARLIGEHFLCVKGDLENEFNGAGYFLTVQADPRYMSLDEPFDSFTREEFNALEWICDKLEAEGFPVKKPEFR